MCDLIPRTLSIAWIDYYNYLVRCLMILTDSNEKLFSEYPT